MSPSSKVFEEITLSNGLPVLLQHFDGPAAATYWWINVGSKDELPKEAGFAHFLEHMLFKDAAAKETGRPSNGALARTIESLGGDINAYTSFEQTVYHVTCAAHHWVKVLDAFGDMAQPQKFLKKDFESEREVILEELRKNEDSPDRMLFQKLFHETFQNHPYGRPVIGFVNTLKRAKVQELEKFYLKNYCPEKMGLILVGPILDQTGAQREALLRLLEKKFGQKVLKARVKTNKLTSNLARTPQKRQNVLLSVLNQKSSKISFQFFDVQQPTVALSFRVPSLHHDDIPALDVLASVLGQGDLSRIYQKLFYQSALVTAASGGMYVPSDPGMFYLQAETDLIEKIPAILAAMIQEINTLKEAGPTEEELRRVLVNSESEKLYSMQTVDGLAGRLGFMQHIVKDMNYDERYLKLLREVDAEAVRDVAIRYLDHKKLSLVIQVPQKSKEKSQKGQKQSEKDKMEIRNLGLDEDKILALFREKLKPEESKPTETKVLSAKGLGSKPEAVKNRLDARFITLKSGLRVVHHERKSSPVFSIHLSAFGGQRLESPQHSGVSNLTSMIWAKGTKGKTAQDISRIIEGHAAGMDGFSGRNTLGLQMTGLARDWSVLSHLFTEVLWSPSFNEDELNHHRRVIEDAIKSVDDHSSQLCSRLFMETLFENHPYGRMVSGTLESVGKLTRQILDQYHQSWIKPKDLVIALSGPIKDPLFDHWLADLETEGLRRLQHPVSGTSLLPPVPTLYEGHGEPDLKAPRWVEKAKGREQTHIIVGGLGVSISSAERFALRLLQTILGGQSGRLFIELREKKSLAYTVSPMSFEGLERGYLGTYIACAPGKRQEAISEIQKVYEIFAKKGPTNAEMKRAQEYYLGRRAMDLQSDGALANHFGLEELYRIPRLSDQELMEKVRSITSKKLQETCQNFYLNQHMVTAVVS